MRFNKHIAGLLVVLLLTGCSAQKKAVSTQQETVSEPETPAWHTCLIQGVRATISRDGESYSASVTMQTVRDSMITISVMPMLGIEMLRLEATPTQMIAIDKMHGQYAKATFADLNRQLTPDINWDILQQICSAELPTGAERARLQYAFGDEVIDLILVYPERQIDVPVRVTNQRLDRYNEIDISKWL